MRRSRSFSATSSLERTGSSSTPPSVSRMVTRFVPTSKPAPSSKALLAAMRSNPFSFNFRLAFAQEVLGLQGEAQGHGPRLPPLQRGQGDVGGGRELKLHALLLPGSLQLLLVGILRV